MKRFVLAILCALTLSVVPACGGDDDDGDTGDTGDTGDDGDSGDTGDNGDGADEPDAGSGASFDAAVDDPAEAFCTLYGDVCGFDGESYPDMPGCVAAFNGYDGARQTCVDMHLGYADAAEDDSADEMEHCGHAAGENPCD